MNMAEELRKPFLSRVGGEQDKVGTANLDGFKYHAVGVTRGVADN